MVVIATSFCTVTAPVSGRTTTVAVCWFPLVIDAHVHVSVPPSELTGGVAQTGLPVVADSARNAAFAGSVSVTTTVDAVDGPLLRAVIT